MENEKVPLPPYGDGMRSDSVDRPIESASRLSFPSSKSDCAPRKEWWGPALVSSLLSWMDFPHRLYRWCGAFRSFRAHIRIQSPKMGTCIPLGQLGLYQGGLGQNDERILFRVKGIEKLRSKCPWADSVDQRMWVMGFEEGEKYSMAGGDHHAQNTQDSQQVKG